MNRRDFLGGLALTGLTGCANKVKTSAIPAAPQVFEKLPPIMPIRAQVDRIFRVTVCLRPFRAAGPRLDVERVGEKTVVHNYGHGGSGWSLSWGSSSIAVAQALATGERDVAVIGCGALGLTSATLLQQSGARVTIYAKERPPDVRSSRATGSWTPDSRVALANSVSPDFPALWEKMCRKSFHTYESYLGLAGNPVEWTDRYSLSDGEPAGGQGNPGRGGGLEFARYQDRVADLTPRHQDLPPGSHPFPTRYATRNSSLTFNVAGYSRQLITDFLIEGGKIENVEFHTPAELTRLTQKVVINATGYGAQSVVERRIDHSRARPNRVADTAARSQLWRAVQGRQHPRPPRRHRGPGWRHRRNGRLQRHERAARPPIGGSRGAGGRGIVPADGVPGHTRRNFVTRPTSTHSTTKIFPL